MEIKRGNRYSLYFDSMLELMDIMESKGAQVPECNKMLYREVAGTRNPIGNSTKGGCGPTVRNVDDAINLAVSGDSVLYEKYVLPKIEKFNEQFNISNMNEPPTVKRKKVKKDFGDEVDIHMVNQGKLDRAWTTTERVEVDEAHHLITILVNIGGNSEVDAIDSQWTTAVCLKLIDEIQRTGKSVKLIVGNIGVRVTANGNMMDWTCCVKRYDEQLSIERLAAMTHIGFYRSVGFMAKTLCSNRVQSTFGRSTNFTNDNLPFNLQDEIDAGNTKLVIVDKVTNMNSAISQINAINAELSR